MSADDSFYYAPIKELKYMTPDMKSDLKRFLSQNNIVDLSIVAYNRSEKCFSVKCPNHLVCKNWLRGDIICDWCWPDKYIFEEKERCYKCDKKDITCVLLPQESDDIDLEEIPDDKKHVCDYKLCISCFTILMHGRIIPDRPIFPYGEKVYINIYDRISHDYLKDIKYTKEGFKTEYIQKGLLQNKSDLKKYKEILDIYCVENMIERYPLLKDYLAANKKWEDDYNRYRSLLKKIFKCPKCDGLLNLYHFPENLPLYTEKGQDLVYEKENMIKDRHFGKSFFHEYIKCKNYKLCKNTIDTDNYKDHSDYLCEYCRINFGGDPPSKGELIFKESISCPVCLECDKTEGVSLPRCEHYVCIKCMRKCFFREDYPPYPTVDLNSLTLLSNFEWAYKKRPTPIPTCLFISDPISFHMVYFLKDNPIFMDYYGKISMIDDKFKLEEKQGKVKLCPICQK